MEFDIDWCPTLVATHSIVCQHSSEVDSCCDVEEDSVALGLGVYELSVYWTHTWLSFELHSRPAAITPMATVPITDMMA
jgi:hypothetical protein